MFLLRLIPPRVLSYQARQPSGWFGRHIMSRIFLKGNAELNAFLKDLLELKQEDIVLEIGFGPGMLLQQMAQITTKGRVEGIDFSDAMIARAQKINKHLISENRVKIQKGDCRDMPYGPESFDKVCTSNTIYFWDRPKDMFKSIYKVLKPGGKLVVGFREADQMKNLPFSKDVFTLYTAEEVTLCLTQAGFSNIRIRKKDGQPFNSLCAVAVKG